MPFSSRWFYGDTLFIVDPWVWLALALGVYFSRRRERLRRLSPSVPGPGRPCRGNTVCGRDGALEHGGGEDRGRRGLLPLGQAGAGHDGGASYCSSRWSESL